MIYYSIILLYISFLLELILWPVSSEGSTSEILRRESNLFSFKSIFNVLTKMIIVVFAVSPLLFALLAVYREQSITMPALAVTGIILSWTGRILTMRGAYILYHNKDQNLVTWSIFKWTRNPVSTGLFITYLGLIMVFPNLLLIAGYVVFIFNIHFKIGFEEKRLLSKYGGYYHDYQKKTPKYLIL